MGKIKGWVRKEKRINNWIGHYYQSNLGSIITFNQIQDRDGKNAFLYSSIYNQKGLGNIKPFIISKGRNEELVKKKAIQFMKSHPRG